MTLNNPELVSEQCFGWMGPTPAEAWPPVRSDAPAKLRSSLVGVGSASAIAQNSVIDQNRPPLCPRSASLAWPRWRAVRALDSATQMAHETAMGDVAGSPRRLHLVGGLAGENTNTQGLAVQESGRGAREASARAKLAMPEPDGRLSSPLSPPTPPLLPSLLPPCRFSRDAARSPSPRSHPPLPPVPRLSLLHLVRPTWSMPCQDGDSAAARSAVGTPAHRQRLSHVREPHEGK